MADTFLGAIRDYLPSELHTRAADDLALIAAFIAPDRGSRSKARERLVRELAGHVAKKSTAWKTAARQVQRWTTKATQRRGKTGFARGKRGDVTRARVQRALLRRARVPVVVHFRGWINFSEKWYKSGFIAPQNRAPISLDELQDILKMARQVEKDIDADAAEDEARKVLIGFYMGDPSDNAMLKEAYSVLLPYSDDVRAWGDGDEGQEAGAPPSVFTIEQVEGGA